MPAPSPVAGAFKAEGLSLSEPAACVTHNATKQPTIWLGIKVSPSRDEHHFLLTFLLKPLLRLHTRHNSRKGFIHTVHMQEHTSKPVHLRLTI